MQYNLKEAKEEITNLKADCLNLLKQVDTYGVKDPSGNREVIFRLLAMPIIYSAWERTFTISLSVLLRIVREYSKTAGELSPNLQALWLQKASFFTSFQASAETNHKPGKGKYKKLTEFLSELDSWRSVPVDTKISLDDVVMTFSNVDKKVVELNAIAIGIDQYTAFLAIDLSKLNELVARRNDIGHGGPFNPPQDHEFDELLAYTVKLITDFCEVLISWLDFKYSISYNDSLIKRILKIAKK